MKFCHAVREAENKIKWRGRVATSGVGAGAPSQISNWLLPNNCTAEHVFAPRTLIAKYVHNHKEKMYACFVGFKKAFD